MKRDGGDDYGYPSNDSYKIGGGFGGGGRGGGRGGSGGKRYRQDDGYSGGIAPGKYEMRLLVTSRSAGGVIGKGGENIKRLRSKFDANLSVPDSQAPERVLTIIATPENVLECLRELIPRLDENRGDDHERSRDRGRKPDKDESEIRILIHESHAGAVIGRGGAKIRELRESTDVRLKVYSACAPQSSERIVMINGDPEKIIECTKLIMEILKEIPIKGMKSPYDPAYYDPNLIADYGGQLPDRNFRNNSRIRGMPEPMGRGGFNGYNSYGRDGGRDFERPVPYGGGLGGGGDRESFGRSPYYPGEREPVGRSGYGGNQDLMGRSGYGGGGGGREPLASSGFGYGGPAAAVSTTQVTIPNELGGAIIGKGGTRIGRVREESGAQIDVEPQRGTGEDRVITITGTREQIQAAQYLLQQCVRSSEAGRSYLSVH